MSRIPRNVPCPCGSGRKYKRCCGAASVPIDAGALSRADCAVGDRIRQWAYANYRGQMEAALDELITDPDGVTLGDLDVQLVALWQLNDRELPGGGTPAERYAKLPGLGAAERSAAQRIASAQLALLRVCSTDPGRSIELEDVSRGFRRTRAVSHLVSTTVRTGDMLVGRLMSGPPAASLWGAVVVLNERTQSELRRLLGKLVRLLELDPSDEDVLSQAMDAAKLEVAQLLLPALHDAQRQRHRRRRAAA